MIETKKLIAIKIDRLTNDLDSILDVLEGFKAEDRDYYKESIDEVKELLKGIVE